MIPFHWDLLDGAERRAGLMYGVDLRHAVALFLHGAQSDNLAARHGIDPATVNEITTEREAPELTLVGDAFRLHLLRKGATTKGAHPVVRVPALGGLDTNSGRHAGSQAAGGAKQVSPSGAHAPSGRAATEPVDEERPVAATEVHRAAQYAVRSEDARQELLAEGDLQ